MNRLFNAGQLLRLIKSFPTSLANVYPVILLSLSSTLAKLAYSSFSKYVQQIYVSTPLCDAVLALNSMFPLSSPIKILCFQQLPIQVPSLMIVLVQYYYKKQTSLAKRANLLDKKYRTNSQNPRHQREPGLV